MYYDAFPLPDNAKFPPPKGVIGYNGTNDFNMLATLEEAALQSKNIGGRLKDGYIGIDIDSSQAGHKLNGIDNIDIQSLPNTLAISRHNNPIKEGFTLIYKTPNEFNVDMLNSSVNGIDRISRNLRYVVLPSSIVNNKQYAFYAFCSSTLSLITYEPSPMQDEEDYIEHIDTKTLLRIFGERHIMPSILPITDANTSQCTYMKKALSIGLSKIESNPSHTNILNTAVALRKAYVNQGHHGYNEAIKSLQTYILNNHSDKYSDTLKAIEWSLTIYGSKQSKCFCNRAKSLTSLRRL